MHSGNASFGSDQVGGPLRSLRRDRGLTQSELAAAAGLTRRTIHRAENGAEMSRDTLSRLERALDLPTGSLVGDLGGTTYAARFGARLRDARRATGESLETVAGALSTSAATLSRLERGLIADVEAHNLIRTEYARLLNKGDYFHLVAYAREEEPD
jgi:transcriptional regulator with XRE-family HTH domain